MNDLSAAIELAEEEEFFKEAVQAVTSLKTELRLLEIQSLLTDPLDKSNALLTINAGAGGTESCDWASMLLRMYLRFCERKSWATEIHDVQVGDEAGIKSATFEVTGENVFGLLKSESGVHRLVRISPFDSNARRHTSFASIFISPVIDDDIEIVINPADLRVDTYRASGAGGQHVNRTDSAIRITHIPTNTVVQCQSQRSQHQNRDTAMKMLKSKLYDLEMSERKKKQEAIESQKADINFGSQIRSYVLHPYKLVKDHRTDFESHEPDAVLDGNLMPFIEEFLSQKIVGPKV
jgi:peptide chain release factor 2